MVKGYDRFLKGLSQSPHGRPKLPPFLPERWPLPDWTKWAIGGGAFVLLGMLALSMIPERRPGDTHRMTEPEVVDAATSGGFLSRIFNIQIEYDDRLDEEAKLSLSRGKTLLKEGKCLEAISYFDDVLQTFPRNGDALFFRAQSLYRVGLVDRAAEDVAGVLRRYPDDLESLVLHADLMSQLNRPEDARKSLQRAERLQPTAAYVKRVMARAYRQVGEWQRAQQLLDRLLHESPRDAASSYEMSLLLSQADDPNIRNPRLALQFARRALRESPENWAYGEAAALALAADGRFAEAIRLQQYVVDVAPKWAWKDCAEQLESYRHSQRQQVTAVTTKGSARGESPDSPEGRPQGTKKSAGAQ